jgi:hypothetical protein
MDEETLKKLRVTRRIESKQEPKGSPRTKERRASIMLKDKEQK